MINSRGFDYHTLRRLVIKFPEGRLDREILQKNTAMNMFGRLVLILICHLSYKKYYPSLLYFFSI